MGHRVVLGALAAALFASSWPIASGQTAPLHVVMISIDGLRPSVYLRPDAARVPTLERLARSGVYASGVVGVFPSVTYPSHTTLITGVSPAEHGIYSNHPFDPGEGSDGSWYWYARDIRTRTLPGALRAQGLRAAAISWPVTVGADLDVLFPEYIESTRRETLNLLAALSKPSDLFDRVESTQGGSLAWPMTDGARTAMAASVFRMYRPHLLLLHLVDTDTAQHEFGPDSREARSAIEQADGQVRHLLDAIEESGLARHTSVVVVSDHGFLPIARQLQLNALFRREGWLEVDSAGRIASWRVCFQSSGGSGFVFLADPRDLALKARVAALLAEVSSDPGNGVQRVIEASELRHLGADPRASFAVDMRDGYYTANDADTLLAPTAAKGGHGFDPGRPALHASLIMTGPTVSRRGDLGVVRMSQIAPSVAAWFGVHLSPRADTPIDLDIR
jgi:predicted AlkP superfamily pyrophosphatase or phosphodiesterase